VPNDDDDDDDIVQKIRVSSWSYRTLR